MSCLYRHARELLDVSALTSDDKVGRTYVVLPSDPSHEHELEFRLWVQPPTPAPMPPEVPECRQPVFGGFVAGARVVIETSVDKVQWLAVHEPLSADELVLTEPVVLGPYVRARTVAEGQPHTANVHLLGSGAFKLELV